MNTTDNTPSKHRRLRKALRIICALTVLAITSGMVWYGATRRALPCGNTVEHGWNIGALDAYDELFQLSWVINIPIDKQDGFLQCLRDSGYTVKIAGDTGVIAARKDNRYILNARDGWSGWLLDGQFQTRL